MKVLALQKGARAVPRGASQGYLETAQASKAGKVLGTGDKWESGRPGSRPSEVPACRLLALGCRWHCGFLFCQQVIF